MYIYIYIYISAFSLYIYVCLYIISYIYEKKIDYHLKRLKLNCMQIITRDIRGYFKNYNIIK